MTMMRGERRSRECHKNIIRAQRGEGGQPSGGEENSLRNDFIRYMEGRRNQNVRRSTNKTGSYLLQIHLKRRQHVHRKRGKENFLTERGVKNWRKRLVGLSSYAAGKIKP